MISLCKIANVLIIVAVVLVILIALEQIMFGFYEAGCFRKYNQIVDAISEKFFGIDPDNAADIVATVAVGAVCALIVATII